MERLDPAGKLFLGKAGLEVRKQGVVERINLQQDGSKAKAYQVRQVRSVILRYNLRGETNG